MPNARGEKIRRAHQTLLSLYRADLLVVLRTRALVTKGYWSILVETVSCLPSASGGRMTRRRKRWTIRVESISEEADASYVARFLVALVQTRDASAPQARPLTGPGIDGGPNALAPEEMEMPHGAASSSPYPPVQ